VHVPRLPEQVGAGEPALEVEVAARGLLAVLRAALATTSDVRVAAGSLG
jgi:pyroglutamyl-peptidase